MLEGLFRDYHSSSAALGQQRPEVTKTTTCTWLAGNPWNADDVKPSSLEIQGTEYNQVLQYEQRTFSLVDCIVGIVLGSVEFIWCAWMLFQLVNMLKVWKTNLETVKQMPFISMGKVIQGSKAFESVLKWIGSIVFHWGSHICGNGTTCSDVKKKANMAPTTSFNHFGLIQIYISVRRSNGSYEALLSCYPPFATYTHHVMTYRWIVNWIKDPVLVMVSFK